jgi:hypothetical protein
MSNSFRVEYGLGYLADTGNWCLVGGDTHPWRHVMEEKLATHAGDPDWDGVELICRPVVPWASASALGCSKPTN